MVMPRGVRYKGDRAHFIQSLSEWYRCTEIITGNYQPLKGWSLYQSWGTEEDHEYTKSRLKEMYSIVEEYTPKTHILEGFGIANHSFTTPPFNHYRDEEKVNEKPIVFGSPTTLVIPHTLTEKKYKCRQPIIP